MDTVPTDLALSIIEFLPIATQLQINKESRANSLPKAKRAIKTISRSLKFNRSRILDLVWNGTESDNVVRSSLVLYTTPATAKSLIRHILSRGKKSYKQSYWVMCMDDRNSTRYPQPIIDSVMLGTYMGWSSKKILRTVVPRLDRYDLNSLAYALNSD